MQKEGILLIYNRVYLLLINSKGLIKLEEPKVSIVCREQDKGLVKEVMNAAAASYKSKTGKDVQIELDNTRALPPGPEITGNVEDSW
jgi:hypothetical protein